MVAFGSGAGPEAVSGVPSSKQKFRERSVYVRLQVGQRFIWESKENYWSYKSSRTYMISDQTQRL